MNVPRPARLSGHVPQRALWGVALLALLVASGAAPAAQGGGRGGGAAQGQGAAQGRGGQAPATPQAAAPFDLDGYWVAVISEDWRFRMVTPAKGDYQSIPLTQAGKDLADQWDPAADARTDACKSYGPPGLMRAPTRLRIGWADPATLQVESDYGMQTRRLAFSPGAPGAPSRQGHSVAMWETNRPAGGRGGQARAEGHLKTVTTRMLPGYLRKNGVPYSADTVLTEFWNVFTAPSGARWLVITSVVHDPENLQIDWLTSLNFRQEPDGSKWDPTPCSTEW
ncbi:MAG: hypothetical protein AB7G23_11275 [Vicinamibacterales bacterium]